MGSPTEDLVVDVSKSCERAPSGVGAILCFVPSSRLYRGKTGVVFGPLLALGPQAIWQADVPAS
eukprot:11173019-Lingulodinium_polyedra.AAC.1